MHVVLFKEEQQADAYKKVFQGCGCTVTFIPALVSQNTNHVDLLKCLHDPGSYAGLVVTSQRALEHVQTCDRAILDKWADGERALYAVGYRTYDIMVSIFGEGNAADLRGKGTKNADQLASLILSEAETFQKPLLFLCGDKRRPDLPDKLRDAGVVYEELEVYSTEPMPWCRMCQVLPEKVDIAAFFSPSGVASVFGTGQPRLVPQLAHATILAIGATTAAALVEAGVDRCITASSPTPSGLLEASNITPL